MKGQVPVSLSELHGDEQIQPSTPWSISPPHMPRNTHTLVHTQARTCTNLHMQWTHTHTHIFTHILIPRLEHWSQCPDSIVWSEVKQLLLSTLNNSAMFFFPLAFISVLIQCLVSAYYVLVTASAFGTGSLPSQSVESSGGDIHAPYQLYDLE